jgi:hypothetical protein
VPEELDYSLNDRTNLDPTMAMEEEKKEEGKEYLNIDEMPAVSKVQAEYVVQEQNALAKHRPSLNKNHDSIPAHAQKSLIDFNTVTDDDGNGGIGGSLRPDAQE